MDTERFGRILMSKLKEIYAKHQDINDFANRRYSIWESLPGTVQEIEPFGTLCYAGRCPSRGDERQVRNFYEHMRDYYGNEKERDGK